MNPEPIYMQRFQTAPEHIMSLFKCAQNDRASFSMELPLPYPYGSFVLRFHLPDLLDLICANS